MISVDQWLRIALGRTDFSRGEIENFPWELRTLFSQLLQVQPEDFFIIGQALGIGGGDVGAGGAGFRSQVGIWNPSTRADNPTIAIVEGMTVGAEVARTCQLRYHAAVFGVVQAARFRDTQWSPTIMATAPVIQCRGMNTAAVAGTNTGFFVRTAAAQSSIIPMMLILAPETGFTWDPNTDNATVTGSFWWREFAFRLK